MNDYITTTKQSTTKPCVYLLGYTVYLQQSTPPESKYAIENRGNKGNLQIQKVNPGLFVLLRSQPFFILIRV